MLRIPGTEYSMGFAGAAGNRDRVPSGAVFLNQIHSSHILFNPAGGESGDGMVFAEGRGIPALRVADCLPVFALWDHFTGAAHAGWRGLSEGIVENLVSSVSQPLRWLILGPCICAGCYETGDDVRDAVCAGDPAGADAHPGGKVDLRGSALRRARHAAGNQFDVIHVNECTMESDDLYSYRYNRTPMRNVIWLAENAQDEHIRRPNNNLQLTPPERRKT